LQLTSRVLKQSLHQNNKSILQSGEKGLCAEVPAAPPMPNTQIPKCLHGGDSVKAGCAGVAIVPQQDIHRMQHLCPWEALPLEMEEAAAVMSAPGVEHPGEEEPPTAKEIAAVSMDAGLLQMQVLNSDYPLHAATTVQGLAGGGIKGFNKNHLTNKDF
jgi:hypothetical protein